MEALHVYQLQKSFPTGFWGNKELVLKDITFSIPEKKATGFVGANGSGKTTTLKTILQFIYPDGGRVEFFGGPLDYSRVGFLPERPYLFDFISGEEFLRYHSRFSSLEDSETKIKSRLKQVDLISAKDKKIRNYSKGMLQRLGLALVLLKEPDLLILDEPLSGLDPDGRILMKALFRQVLNEGKTLFFSTHLLEDVEELCENIVIIDGGKTLFSGTLKQLTDSGEKLEFAYRTLKGKAK